MKKWCLSRKYGKYVCGSLLPAGLNIVGSAGLLQPSGRQSYDTKKVQWQRGRMKQMESLMILFSY
jgi:hypothetical protein